MAFTTQDIRENYERMGTEELLSAAGKDLTDIAREVLNEVLVGRGLTTDAVNVARAQVIEVQARFAESQNGLASRTARIAAFGIDFFGIALVTYFVFLPLRIFSDASHEVAMLVVFWAYFLFRDGMPGQSVGKRIMSLVTVQIHTGKPASFENSFWRNLAHFFFVVDGLFALGNRRMRLGDMIAGTKVIRNVKL